MKKKRYSQWYPYNENNTDAQTETEVEAETTEIEDIEEKVSSPQQPKTGIIVNTKRVNVRTQPDGPISGTIPEGNSVTILGETNEYYLTNAGYIQKKFIKEG